MHNTSLRIRKLKLANRAISRSCCAPKKKNSVHQNENRHFFLSLFRTRSIVHMSFRAKMGQSNLQHNEGSKGFKVGRKMGEDNRDLKGHVVPCMETSLYLNAKTSSLSNAVSSQNRYCRLTIFLPLPSSGLRSSWTFKEEKPRRNPVVTEQTDR